MSGEGATVPLRGRQAMKYPTCVGRRAECKDCGEKKILPEAIY